MKYNSPPCALRAQQLMRTLYLGVILKCCGCQMKNITTLNLGPTLLQLTAIVSEKASGVTIIR